MTSRCGKKAKRSYSVYRGRETMSDPLPDPDLTKRQWRRRYATSSLDPSAAGTDLLRSFYVPALLRTVSYDHLDIQVAFRRDSNTGEPIKLDSSADGHVHEKWSISTDAFDNKLGLLFRMQQCLEGLDRVELMSVRINNFTAEEANYWLSRILHFSDASNRWAAAGMRIMLGGQSGDPAIAEMLKQIDHKE
jgi:hypothetical protein